MSRSQFSEQRRTPYPDARFPQIASWGGLFALKQRLDLFPMVTAAKMESLGILTGADLRDRGLDELTWNFGTSAGYFHRAAHGEDDRPVQPDRLSPSVLSGPLMLT